MKKTKLTEDLESLSSGYEKRSQTARLREVIDDVEATLASGVPRAEVLKVLNKHGFKMTLSGFDAAMWRIRKKRSTVKPAMTPARAKHEQDDENKQGKPDYPSSDPRELDKIFGATHDLEALAKHAKKLDDNRKEEK